jgi:hypothetical protein
MWKSSKRTAGVEFVGKSTAIKMKSRSETAPQATRVTSGYRRLSREIRRIVSWVDSVTFPRTFAPLGIERAWIICMVLPGLETH